MTKTHHRAEFAAALSTVADTAQAAREAARQARAALSASPNLALVFASLHHQPEFERLADVVYAEVETDCLLGCTGESIVCNDREIEGEPAVAVWLAHLPDARLLPMHLKFQQTPEGGAIVGWHEELPDHWPAEASLLLLAEPFSFPADVLLERLRQTQPHVRVVGGMASGGSSPGENRLVFSGREVHGGAVALLIDAPVPLRTVVSQGCRPIGSPLVITKAERNVIFQLGGLGALVQLQKIFGELSPEDQQLVRGGLHVGQVINEYQEGFGRGDFLVRNVQGIDPDSGGIVIGDWARVGRTVQFHVRDAATADEDLRALLGAARQQMPDCGGGLLFTCNGRGTRLFDAPHHDAQVLAHHWPGLPVAGFFAQGEIGPVGGQNFVHGFTASIALFGPSS